MPVTRRGFLHGLGALAATPVRAVTGLQARYDVEATVLFLGLAIFRKSGVGEARIHWRGSVERSEVEFSAGSYPDRTRGLNRLGYFSERCEPDVASYFGFMTSSKEESFESARKAWEQSGSDGIPYSVTEGRLKGSDQVCRISNLLLPRNLCVSNLDSLVDLVRQRFIEDTNHRTERSSQKEFGRTFLRSVMVASCAAGPSKWNYSFNAKCFTLQAKVRPDQGLKRLDGVIHSQANGKKTPFSLWRPNGGDPALPERFEYQPKSYLRLSFRRIPDHVEQKG